MQDRAQLTWIPELSSVEFSGGQGGGSAWLIGRSDALARLRSAARSVGQTGFAAAVVVGEAGSGKARVGRLVHRCSRRGKLPLCVLDAMEPDAVAQLASLKAAAQEAAMPVGNVLVEHTDRAPAKVIELLLGLLAAQGAVARCGLILLSEARPAQVRQKSLQHEQLMGRAASAMLDVPPLRRRPEDIEPLARHFLRQAAARYSKSVRGVSPQALNALTRHVFVGNVRELQMTIEQAVLRASGDVLTLENFPDLRGSQTASPAGDECAQVLIRLPGASLRDIELQALRMALRLADGRLVRAAELLGITRHALRRKLDKYGLSALRAPARGEPDPATDDAYI